MVAKFVGATILFLIAYFALSALILFASLFLLRNNIPIQLPWFYSVQKFLYFNGLRNIWQGQPGCVVFDETLIYKPANGRCVFRNIEFDTTLEFSNGIRNHESINSARKGIAVIGDSHAMGWGVNNNETFSSLLQTKLQRPVFNLAVSSYGTVRELLALEQSKIVDEVDTVIIQYSYNDLDENIGFRFETIEINKLKFNQISRSRDYFIPSSINFMLSSYYHALAAPFISMRNYIKGDGGTLDFTPHYQPLLSAIKDCQFLKHKTVIIFYSNSHGVGFFNFPHGRDKYLPNVVFVDLNIPRTSYYILDDHLTKGGHELVADKLYELFKVGG